MGMKISGTVAIVTGASSGIGAATARLLAKNGASIAMVARRKDRPDGLNSGWRRRFQADGTSLRPLRPHGRGRVFTHRANTERLPNPIEYTYMKAENFSAEKELRVSLSTIGWRIGTLALHRAAIYSRVEIDYDVIRHLSPPSEDFYRTF